MKSSQELKKMKVYELGRPLDKTTPVSPTHPPFTMGILGRHGDVVREGGLSGANEIVVMSCHTGTHIDALCHVAVNGKLHGDVDANSHIKNGQFTKWGAETIGAICSRGVLFDFPALYGTDSLDGEQRITSKDFDKACSAFGIEVHEGDAVFIRTGWATHKYHKEAEYLGFDTGVPGPDISTAGWLNEHKVQVTGSDTLAYEWIRPGTGLSELPVHAALLVDYGIYIVEELDLDTLASEQIYQFIFLASPIKITGATGSPINPLAIVTE